MKEREYKFLVDQHRLTEIYHAARKQSGQPVVTTQINYYFDDAQNSLNRRGITLRIRQKGHRLMLQYKEHDSCEAHLTVSQETEKELYQLPPVIDRLYTLKGLLVTQRQRFMLQPGLSLDLDTNYYLGICDYEIELEFSSGQAHRAKAWMESLGLHLQPISQSKSSRFFTQLEQYAFELQKKAGNDHGCQSASD